MTHRSCAASTASVVTAVLIPKCPFCIAALLATAGVSIPASQPLAVLFTALLVAVPLALLLGTRFGQRSLPLVLVALLGAALILAGKFTAAGSACSVAGTLILMTTCLYKTARRKTSISK